MYNTSYKNAMKYLNRISYIDVKDKYDYIIAWGTGSLFQINYRNTYFPINFIIDGAQTNIGKTFYDIEVYSPSKLKEISGKLLIVLYANNEIEILNQLASLDIEADTIIYNFLQIKTPSGRTMPIWNGKNADDIIINELIDRIGMQTLEYLDIGVCHPVIRNNTYFLHEMGFHGVLVEPNPLFHKLITDYRPNDKLLKCGAAVETAELHYYSFPQKIGYNTFLERIGEERCKLGYDCEKIDIPVQNINSIISENFLHYPNILDIDTEGFDYDLLSSLNTERYPIEIIICETMGATNEMNQLLYKKAYVLYANLKENSIYIRKDINQSGLSCF